MDVTHGIFHGPWGPVWQVAVRGDMTVGMNGSNFLRDVFEVDVMPSRPPTGTLTEVVNLGVPYALGYESGDHRNRYVFPQINSVEVHIRKVTRSLYRFTAPAEHGPTMYVAGTSPSSMPMPRSSAPVLAPWVAPAAPYGGSAVDLVPGRLRGFRHWKLLPGVEGSPPRLASITADMVWPWTPVVEAHCHRAALALSGFDRLPPHDPDDVPAPAPCTCGIYAKHRLESAGIGHGRVAGVIEAWGKVEVGDRGFRARYARLVALAVNGNATAWPLGEGQFVTYDRVEDGPLARLGELYRVPVFDDERAMVEAYPPGDVSELLGGNASARRAECAGCAANAHGDYAEHSETCQRDRYRRLHRDHVHVSFAPGGPITHGKWPTPNQMGT
jgi:hypothetical protein